MRRGSGWLFMLCVFIAGVFFGIWMDWSAPKARNFVYQVQDYPMANLQVFSGDRLWLVPPQGGNGAGLAMKFVGYSPCTSGLTPANPCVIEAGAAIGPYLFTCSSGAGYTCTDPGVQQSGTGPIQDLSYGGFVKTDFTHLFGMRRASLPKPEPSKLPGAHPATNAVTAYVSCQNGTTALQDPNGNDLTTITASKGQSVFWISAKQFTLDMSSAPAGLCSNGNPGNGSTQQAQCDIALSGQTVQYMVQAQTSPACSALAATLITK